MGTVYLARDQRLGRQVAVKMLHVDDLEKDDRRARFTREARAAASISHQNVATIFEVDETDDGVPYIVMEYCEGETLSQRMRRRPLDAAEFLTIARQIAAGLAAAHDNGIVHRDIKSANIILEPTGTVKILDFGLAKLVSSGDLTEHYESSTGHFFGTLHYISPEQASGKTADERSDLFAVGVVLYQMATGQLPFNADAPLMVLEKIRHAEPEPLVLHDQAFPPAAVRVISKLLQKEPADRYQSARELLGDLDAIETPTVRLTQTQTRSSLGRTVPRPSSMRIGLIVAALAVLIVAVYLLRTRGAAPIPPPTDTIAPTAATPIRSIAVLPLDNISANAHDDFLSVGLADALVTKLQQIPSLQVRPTSAVLAFHNKKVDVKAASQQLGVDSVLEGHFLAAGNLVRVNLQLTDTRTGYSVWADSVNGKRQDLMQLIDDVSSRTLTGLNQKLGVQQPATGQRGSEPRSKNPKAYEEYLKARALTGSLDPGDHAAHMAALQRAIELDPTFAAAYADLAISISLAEARGLNPPGAMQRAEWYARQAVRLDPNLAEAHLALGRVFVRNPQRFRESVRENLAAVRLNANDSQSLNSIATYFVSLGELDKTKCILDRMEALDPSANEVRIRGYWNVNAVDPEGALQNAGVALEFKDSVLAGHDIRAYALLLRGDVDGASREADQLTALVPKIYLGRSIKAMAAVAKGDVPTAEALMQSLEPDAERNHWAAMRLALCHAKLGHRDQAIRWVTKSAELGNHSWYAWVKHPWMQSLQADPEFQMLLGKMRADLDDVRDDVIGVYQLICK